MWGPNLPFLALPQPTLPDWYLVDVYPNLPFLPVRYLTLPGFTPTYHS